MMQRLFELPEVFRNITAKVRQSISNAYLHYFYHVYIRPHTA